MDFAFTQDQEALRELARKILTDHVTPDRLKQLTAAGAWLDRDAWNALASASLLGVTIPEAYGGSGLGVMELGLLLEEVGRTVAPVPLLPSLVLGGLPVAGFGTEEQKQRLLPGVASGGTILTAALVELGLDDPWRPQTTARRDGAGWKLDGVKTTVPAADLAERILVPARTGDTTVGVFLVDPNASGVTRERQILTNAEPHARLTLAGVTVPAADVLGDPAGGEAIVRWLWERAVAAYCAVQLGVCERALRMTAEYTTERKQFDRPIATFQAVQQRAADAYIDLDAIRMTAWEALFRLDQGTPATEAVWIAKFWASEGGQRIAVATQHLHGGIGVDIDYPLHRYFLWAKHIELVLGSGPAQLARIGAQLGT